MKRHRFDPLSFIFGVLFLIAGLSLVVGESGIGLFEGRWVFPAFLVLAGVVVLATSQFSAKEEPESDQDSPSYEDQSSGIR